MQRWCGIIHLNFNRTRAHAGRIITTPGFDQAFVGRLISSPLSACGACLFSLAIPAGFSVSSWCGVRSRGPMLGEEWPGDVCCCGGKVFSARAAPHCLHARYRVSTVYARLPLICTLNRDGRAGIWLCRASEQLICAIGARGEGARVLA